MRQFRKFSNSKPSGIFFKNLQNFLYYTLALGQDATNVNLLYLNLTIFYNSILFLLLNEDTPNNLY